jgi:hypothetical protein
MPCNCNISKVLTTGSTSIEIGTISSNNADVFIYVENQATGVIYRQEATSSGAGVVTLDSSLPSTGWYNPSATYKVWVTLDTADNLDDAETITISGTDYTCFIIRFERIIGDDEQYDNITSQKITV